MVLFCEALMMMGMVLWCGVGNERLGDELVWNVLAYAGWEEEMLGFGVELAYCESRHYPDPDDPETGVLQVDATARGLFQIHPEPWEGYGGSLGWSGDLLDPVDNARLAWLIVLYDRVRNQEGRQWPHTWGVMCR